MINTICKDNFICDALINENIHVVVLDDRENIRDIINEIISKELGWKVIIIENREDAVKLCQGKKAVFYIFDVHLGPKRPQEGFDAADEIKVIDPNIFVCIFSGVPNVEEYRKMAENIDVNYFQEKGNVVREDVLRIALQMLFFQRDFLNGTIKDCFSSNTEINHEIKVQRPTIFSKIREADRKIEQVINKLDDIQTLEEKYESPSANRPTLGKSKDEKKGSNFTFLPIEEDKNILQYQEYLKEDSEWREKYQDKYVAFADGEWLENFVADNSKDLLNQLRNSEHKGKPIFYKKVPKNNIVGTKESDKFIEEEEVYELPISFYDLYVSED